MIFMWNMTCALAYIQSLIIICLYMYTHEGPTNTNASSSIIILAGSVPSGVVVIVILLIVMTICVIALRKKRQTPKGGRSSNRGKFGTGKFYQYTAYQRVYYEHSKITYSGHQRPAFCIHKDFT